MDPMLKDLDNLSVIWALAIIAVGAMLCLPAEMAKDIILTISGMLGGYLAKTIKDAIFPKSPSSNLTQP